MTQDLRALVLGFLVSAALFATACGSADTPEATAPAPATPAAGGETSTGFTASPAAKAPVDLSSLKSLPLTFADIIAAVRPAVVSITVRTQTVNPFTGRPVPSVGAGTGVFIDPQGFILTNEHVIADATRIEVATDDDKTYIAEVIGKDANSDLAVLKIADQKSFPALPFAPADSYHVGDWVISVGNALGLPGGPTVSIGVISALDRSITVDDQTIGDLIQTDAVINEGNSGGPLVNLKGEIVGITSIAAGESQTVGYGFAISSFTAAPVSKVLIQNGRITWASLGIGVEDLSAVTALQLDLSVRQGVIVSTIYRNGPGHVAGLLPGDILVSVDSNAIRRVRDFDLLLREKYRAGQQATVKFLRNGEERTTRVTFTEPPRR